MSVLTIRGARREDHAAYAELFRELGVPDPIPDAETWTEKQVPTTLIAEESGAVVGYLFYEHVGSTLYIRNVVSAPTARRRGIGRALMKEVLVRRRAPGTRDWCLNVKEDNVPAIRLYESLGLRIAYTTHVLQIPWSAQVPASDAIEVRTPLPGEGAVLEPALGLLSGLVEHHRKLERVLLAAFDEHGEAAGFASYNPAFPGAFPFKAKRVEVAGTLLRAMAPYRLYLQGDDWRSTSVQLVLEDEATLSEELVHLGATCVLKIFHMKAPLPPA